MLDTEKLSQRYYKKASAYCGYDVSKSMLLSMIGKNTQDTKAIAIEHFGESFPLDKVRQKISEYIDEYIKQNGIPKKKDLNKLLDFCKSCNLKLAVATSTQRDKAESLLFSAKLLRNC